MKTRLDEIIEHCGGILMLQIEIGRLIHTWENPDPEDLREARRHLNTCFDASLMPSLEREND